MSLEQSLREAVGPAHVLVDPDLMASYSTDWTGRFSGLARCVVRPGSTVEVVAVVRACAAAGVPIVPQGGNTGLVAGAVPSEGSVVVSLRRLDAMEPVDLVACQVTAGAGVVLSRLQAHARAAGLDVGIDFAARDSATIGGIVATNAGGERVLRYGTTRTQVAGVEAVLADGSVIRRLAGLPKDNTGYDLTGVLTGSEGTLGIVTTVRLRLVPWRRSRVVALLAVDGVDGAVAAFTALRELPSLEAAELFFLDGLQLVCAQLQVALPFPVGYPAYLLVECADVSDPTEALSSALEALSVVRDAAVAGDARGREALWTYREAHTEAVNAAGVPVKLDVAVPLGALDSLVSALPETVCAVAPGARTIVWGHLAEGNLHVNVLGVEAVAEEVTDAVLRLVTSMGGSISAEHGVGRAKTRWLSLSRSPAELAAMRAIKRALDPSGLLNPGVLLPPA